MKKVMPLFCLFDGLQLFFVIEAMADLPTISTRSQEKRRKKRGNRQGMMRDDDE
jgi:hypothetical protein